MIRLNFLFFWVRCDGNLSGDIRQQQQHRPTNKQIFRKFSPQDGKSYYFARWMFGRKPRLQQVDGVLSRFRCSLELFGDESELRSVAEVSV